MVIRTHNSTYEVDTDNKRIRRIHGTQSTRITDDWKTYLNISDIRVGMGVAVVWAVEPAPEQGDGQYITKTTLTSPIVEVIDKTFAEIVN